ncbi:uncharacterized protein TRUGW13939_06336 [Talaromyces rugulosus]|uniref:Protein kinase domain-containing protein n=1 Tax=Talaromyces rugulosus TaxID=121627 RepID=A0A7H8QYJ7_TALRU|nr:uncharacterized protein TRUGW13939_06336 [Talaromyces rugulosus]QKX59204.1 hypothetical protein TRUGW13939_06336 [Talaromyces rugulosus]
MPRPLTFYKLLSGGHTGWVYKINGRVVVKYPTRPNEDDGDKLFQHEIEFFDMLDNVEPCPHIVQSFLRVPAGNFLSYMAGGSIHERLLLRQTRDDRRELTGVTGTEPRHLVERWLTELCGAVSWLESLQYVHGDLRPPNLLLDGQEHLKLADFDRVARIGTDANAEAPPWERVLGPEAGDERGSFGKYGPRTEQFAIGSVLYCLTRSYEPYEMDTFEDPAEVVGIMQRMEYPPLSDDDYLDGIIGKCWHNQFALLKDLYDEVKTLNADEATRESLVTPDDCVKIRNECQSFVDEGLLVLE